MSCLSYRSKKTEPGSWHFIKPSLHPPKKRFSFIMYLPKINKSKIVHRAVWEAFNGPIPKGLVLDHIDRDSLNNNLSNLRLCTQRQNTYNRSRQSTYAGRLTSSQYKGVTWSKRRRKWLACIVLNRKSKYLGCYTTEKEAAVAYDDAAYKYFREFASVNFEFKGIQL